MFRKQEKSKNSDIDILKNRFAQLQQGEGSQQQAQSNHPPSAQAPRPASQQPQRQAMPDRPEQPSPQQNLRPQQPQQPQAPRPASQQPQASSSERSPFEALQRSPKDNQDQYPDNPVDFVEVEGDQGRVVQQGVIGPEQELPYDQQPQDYAQTSPPVSDAQSPVEENLEELKEEYDDAKLNSIIIEQVKELIEIDNNLNGKIDDLRVDLKKEVVEREKLEKQSEERYKELKELEKSIEKFIALYEVVTNQFNPFVKQEGPVKQEVEEKSEDERAEPKKRSPIHDQTDMHFVTKTGKRIRSIHELIGLLEHMDEDEFSHHVSLHKNDFSAWIQQALQKDDIATKVAPIRDQKELIATLKSFDNN